MQRDTVWVMQASNIPEAKLRQLVEEHVEGRTPGICAIEVFAAFIAELDLPRRLAEVGVAEDRFEPVGKNAMLSIFTQANPQPNPRTRRRRQDTQVDSLNSRALCLQETFEISGGDHGVRCGP
jgi:hypothetical protein